MANMNKNLGIMDDPDDVWRKTKAKASTKTVLKNRNLEEESKDFFQAQLDMTKDFLPPQTMAQKGTVANSDKVRLDLYDQQWHRNEDTANQMTMTPTEAFNKVYPHGNPVPVSAAQNPTSSIADDHKGGYRGDEGVPQGKIGALELEVKGTQIGDHYLPDTAWNGPDKVKMPPTQISSSSTENRCNTNLGGLIQDALNKINKNMNSIDMSGAIASTKEKQVLNKPFKTKNCKAAYAVYVKNAEGSIVRVDFDACQASDPTNLGPVWTSQHWGSQVNVAKANEDCATLTLDQLSDFYYQANYKTKDEPWNGYQFYSQQEILAAMPSLKLAPSSYTLNVATKKGEATPSDTKYNSEVKAQLDAAK